MQESHMQPHYLSLIIPVYKQERTIIENIKQIKAVLDNIRYDHEILVIIDGMLDKSYQKIKKAAIPKVRVIAYKHNQGKSYAIRHGMKKARGDYVMFLDA